MDDIRNLAIERFAESRATTAQALDLDSELDDEEDDVVEDLARAVGLEPQDLFPQWPGTRRSELAVAGLRRLAPFSSRAAKRLDEQRIRWEVPTIGSFISSLEERRPVGSGRWEETRDDPIPLARTTARFLAWSVLPAVPLTLLAWSGCNPACRTCPTLAESAWSPVALLPLGITAGLHALMLLAAMRELLGTPRAAAAALP